MQMVSFVSVKGGAGKSTSLMAAASGLRKAGRRVALFEADKNDTLKLWRRNARKIGTWDEECAIFDAADMEQMGAAFEAAEGEGYEIALLDSEGGASEVNTTAILSSDLVLIPLSLSPLDIEFGIDTFQYVGTTLKSNDATVETAFVITRFSPTASKLSSMEIESLELLDPLPQVTARLPSRAAFAGMPVTGMLHLYHEGLLKVPGKRYLATHTGVALREAEALSQDILDVVLQAQSSESRAAMPAS